MFVGRRTGRPPILTNTVRHQEAGGRSGGGNSYRPHRPTGGADRRNGDRNYREIAPDRDGD